MSSHPFSFNVPFRKGPTHQVPKTSPQVNSKEKKNKKGKVQQKLNKSLEQGLNLSGS